MTPEEALDLLDSLLHEQKLKDVQEIVFRYSWQGWTYPEMAEHAGYDTSYMRDVGYELWRQLSDALGEPVTKKNIQAVLRRQQHQQAAIAQPTPTEPHEPSLPAAPSPRQHWGEAIDVSRFYGRDRELALLRQWVRQDRCRLVALVGMGGMGKTALAAKLAAQLLAESAPQPNQFDAFVWRSLRNAPPIAVVLADLMQVLSNPQEALPAPTIDQLMEKLRTSRCLLVLDNLESILASCDASTPQAGQYKAGYEGYDELLRRIGSERHASCLVLTSREKPKTLIPLEGETLPVRTLPLPGLSAAEIREIFQVSGCGAADAAADWSALADRYAGNPLALKIVATIVRDLFDGSIAEFLEQGAIAFGDISTLLHEQFDRLAALEKQVMYWLAINREWVSLTELRSDVPNVPPAKLLEALLSLGRRFLIEKAKPTLSEKHAGLFTLQPVVMEYVTEQLIDRVAAEIETQQPELFLSHALIKAQAKDYVRESQVRVILVPLVSRLVDRLNRREVEAHLKQLLSQLRTEFPMLTGYGGGNLINLLCQLKVDLSGYDFSGLSIWQAYLQNVRLHDVNFADADLAKSVFTQTFSSVLSAAFSPDSQLLATGDSNGEICVWQVTGGQAAFLHQGHTDWVTSVAFSPDGQLLASGSDDCTIKLWETATGEILRTLHGHDRSVRSIAFSPDGQLLASSSHDCTIKLWQTETGQLLRTLPGHDRSVRSIAFSPDGETIASSGDDCTIKLWEVATGEIRQTFLGHDHSIPSIVFSRDGQRLISGSSDRTIRLWHVQSGQCLAKLTGHSHAVLFVALHPDGQLLASSSEDRTVKLWDIETGQCLKTLQAHRDWVWTVAFSPNGQLLATGSDDQTVKLWNVQTGQCLKTLSGYTNQVFAIGFHPDGQTLVSGSLDGRIHIWDTPTGEVRRAIQAHQLWVRATEFSPDGQRLASASTDKTIKLWDADGQALKTLQGHSESVRAVAWSPDGQRLASASADQTLRVWEVATGVCLQTLAGHTSWVRSVAWSFDGQTLASASDDQTLRLWDLATGADAVLKGHEKGLLAVAWSPDGQTIASGSTDHTIRLWSSQGQCWRQLQGHTSQVQSVAFSPSGQTLASGSGDHTIRVWDVATGQILRILIGHTNQVQCVAWSPDGETIASGSNDGTIKLWQLATGDCLKTLIPDRPYERMDITGATGLTQAQKATLRALGAVER